MKASSPNSVTTFAETFRSLPLQQPFQETYVNIVNIVEPPSCSSRIVLIGKNSRGQWVAQHQNGLYGGLFVQRADAVRYALFENGHRPESIIAIGCTLELDMGTPPLPAADVPAMAPLAVQRRAA